MPKKQDPYARFRVRLPRREPYTRIITMLQELPGHEAGHWIREAILEKAGLSPRPGSDPLPVTAVPPTAELSAADSRLAPDPIPAPLGNAARISPEPPASAIGHAPVAEVVMETEGSAPEEDEGVPLDSLDRDELRRLGGLVAAI